MQRTAKMDLRWVKENYGTRFGLIGNIDSSRTLPFGTPDDVMAEAKDAIESPRRVVVTSWPPIIRCTTASRLRTSWPCARPVRGTGSFYQN